MRTRDIMTAGSGCIEESASVLDAARRLAELDVGALPVRGKDHRLTGIVTDRDIVIKALAAGLDPAATRVGEIAQDDREAITVGADDPIEEALLRMADHQLPRLPVIDGSELVGVVAQADIVAEGNPTLFFQIAAAARSYDGTKVGYLVEAIS